MKKITLFACCLIGMISFGQVSLNETFDSGTPAGWTDDYANTTDSPCNGSSSERRNMYSSATTGFLTSPNLVGASNATDLVISFNYKIVDYEGFGDAGAATPAGWGSATLQYSTDDGATWTDVLTIDDSNHTVSVDCAPQNATIVAANLPMGSDVKLQIINAWTAGDYFFYVDDFAANQTATNPPNCDSVLTSPLDGATDVLETADLSWSAATGGATGYRVTVGTTTGANDVADAVDVSIATSYDLPELTLGQQYFVTVTPYNSVGNATGCNEESFTVRATIPPGEVCSVAINIPLVADCSMATPTTLDYANATDIGPFSCDGTTGNNGFWLEFTSGTTGAINFNVGGTTNEYAIFDACGGTELICGGINESLTLSGLTPNTNYKMALWRDSATSGTSDVCFEDVNCLFPTDSAVSVTSATEASISWTPGNTPAETVWEYVVQDAGTGLPTVAGVSTTMNPTSLTGLTEGNEYEYYVRADCGGGSFSVWAGPVTWTQAVPPANDDPSGAVALTLGFQFADNQVTTTNFAATASEVADTTIPDPTCSSYSGGDLWYIVVAPSSGVLAIETNRDPASDPVIGDTGMTVYTGSIGAFVQAGCDDDDSADGAHALLEFDLDGADSALAGQTLYVRVFEYGNNAFGTWFTSAYTPVVNDECSDASAVAFGNEVTGNNTGATDSTVTGDCFTGNIRDVWYSVAANATGAVYVNGLTAGFQYGIYSDCNGTLAAPACNEGATGLTDGITYYIRISDDGTGTSRASGAFTYTPATMALSTNDFDRANFAYYPNPVKRLLTLNAQQNIDNVVVFNLLGQEVLRVQPNSVNTEVEMSSLANGAYFVKVSISGATQTVRIIKQ